MARRQLDPEAIVAGLMDRATEGREVRFAGHLTTTEENLDRFHEQFAFFSRHRLGMPCLITNELDPLPVDTADVVGPVTEWSQEAWSEYGPLRGVTRGTLSALSDRSHMRYDEYPPDEVVGFLRARLSGFVRSFVGGNGRLGDEGPAAGLDVRVHTHIPDLNVHCSPSYLLRLMTFFGAPTTPAPGCLPPGRWRFLVTNNTVPLTLDPGNFDIPPTEIYLSVM